MEGKSKGQCKENKNCYDKEQFNLGMKRETKNKHKNLLNSNSMIDLEEI